MSGEHAHGHTHVRPRRALGGWWSDRWRSHSHDAADSVDVALEGSAAGIRAVRVSLLGLAATARVMLMRRGRRREPAATCARGG